MSTTDTQVTTLGVVPEEIGFDIDGQNYGEYRTSEGEVFDVEYILFRGFLDQFTDRPSKNRVEARINQHVAAEVLSIRTREDLGFNIRYSLRVRTNVEVLAQFVFPFTLILDNFLPGTGNSTLQLNQLRSLTRQDVVIFDPGAGTIGGIADDIGDAVGDALNNAGGFFSGLGGFLNLVIPLALVALILVGLNKLT